MPTSTLIIIITMIVMSLVLVLGILGYVFYTLYIYMVYKHTIIIRQIANGRVIIKEDLAKTHLDKRNNTKRWKLKKEKDKELKIINIPPQKIIDVKNNGRYFVECYRTDNGDIIWVHDKAEVGEIPKDYDKDKKVPNEILNIESDEERNRAIFAWKDSIKHQYMKDNNIKATFEPITSNQRIIHFQHLQQANSRKKQTRAEVIQAIVNVTMAVLMFIIIIMHLVMWDTISEPFVEKEKEKTLQLQALNEGLKSITELQGEVQVLKDNRDKPPD